MTTNGRTGSDRRAIMRTVVLRLSDRLPQLADRLSTEIRGGAGGHRPWSRDDDLREACVTGLGHSLATILDPGRGRADLWWAERLGRRRAEQGQPLDQLLRSYRLAGRVFWEAVVEVADQEDPAYLPVLLRETSRTWEAIDQQSGAIISAYHRTEQELLRRGEEKVRAAIDALLDGRGTNGGVLADAVSLLGLAAQGRYAVVVLSRPLPDAAGPSRPDERNGMRFLWRMRAQGQVALVSLGSADLDELAEALRPHVLEHAGVSTVVESLADVGAARRLAETALRTCRADGAEVAVLERRLPESLLAAQPRLAARLDETVLGALDTLTPAHRDELLDTLIAWLDADGSAAQAAKALYCHPNTVLSRLRRIERLTGRLRGRPRDLVELALASKARRLSGDGRETRPPPER
ncbi:helix-turn-helix domain-containing protein [Actinomadura fulvescens]|uniref:Helix-turn-helix domain-containing protein n=1 Tax=Actinomadura fulvescens TaxID=46160 RepID=A0ABN3QDC1_9ACTN